MGSQYSDRKKAIGRALQAQRKKAGFKSARAFALSIGINPNTYTDYEQGRGAFSYEQAWQFADALGCTLDEVGGREWPAPGVEDLPADEGELLGNYRASDPPRQDTLRQLARDMAGISRDEAEAEAYPRRQAA